MWFSAFVTTETGFDIRTAKGNVKRHPKMFAKHHFKEKEIIEHEKEISAGEETWNFSFTLDKDLRSTLLGMPRHIINSPESKHSIVQGKQVDQQNILLKPV